MSLAVFVGSSCVWSVAWNRCDPCSNLCCTACCSTLPRNTDSTQSAPSNRSAFLTPPSLHMQHVSLTGGLSFQTLSNSDRLLDLCGPTVEESKTRQSDVIVTQKRSKDHVAPLKMYVLVLKTELKTEHLELHYRILFS